MTLFGSHLTCREDGGQRSCASWHLHSRAYWQCVSWIRLRPRPSVQRRLKQQARTNRLFLLRPIVAVPGIAIGAAAKKFRSRSLTTERASARAWEPQPKDWGPGRRGSVTTVLRSNARMGRSGSPPDRPFFTCGFISIARWPCRMKTTNSTLPAAHAAKAR